jgi:PAS domain S-box-containing protein
MQNPAWAGTDRRRREWVRYGSAVLAVAVALAISLTLGELNVQSPFTIFLTAVAVAAWFGGPGPGLLATALAGVILFVVFVPPVFTLSITSPIVLVRLIVFAIGAGLINLLGEARARSETAARTQAARFAVTLGSIGDAVIATDLLGQVTFLNAVAEALTGWRQADALGRPAGEVFRLVDAQTREPLDTPISQVLRTGQTQRLGGMPLCLARDGTTHPVDDSAAPIRDAAGQVQGVVLVFRDVTAQAAAEAERVAALEREQVARADAEAAQARFAFLAEASGVLASSLDYQATLAAVADLAVPRVADWCAVDLLDEQGIVRRLAVAHVDPAKVAWAHELQERYPPDPDATSGVYQVIRTGTPEILPDITPEMIRAATSDPDLLAIIDTIGFTSAITMPLTVRDRTLGALTLVSAESGRHYGPADVALAEDLARRAATAIDNARLYREAAEQRERFAVTLASIGDAVIATDARGQVTFLNHVAAELTGWDPAAAAGQDLATVFHIVNEETRAIVENPATRVIREGVTVGLANHTILLDRQGGEHPIDDSGAPIRDAGGALLGVVLVFRDISGRKADELALRESEARFRTLVDSAPVLVWMAGPDGGRTFFNRPWLDFTGRTEAQEQGAGWLAGVHPDDLARCRDTYGAALAAREPFRLEYRLRRAGGVYRWVLDTGVPRWAPGGAFAGFIGSCIDITERQESEERLRFLTEAGALLSASLDYEATLASVAHLTVPAIADNCAIDLVYADTGLRRVVIDAADPQRGELLRDLYRRYPPDPRALGIFEVLESGRSRLVAHVDDAQRVAPARDAAHAELLRAAGTTSYMVVPFVARGRVIGTLALNMAESSRHYGPADLALAEALAARAALAVDNARLYQEAQAAIGTRDQFLSIASHELKTPLTSLLMAAQLIQRRTAREGTLNPRDQRALTVVVHQASRLNRMVLSLLDLSRIESGQLSIEEGEVDLTALVRSLHEEVTPTLEQHTLAVEAPAAPVLVRGDALRLEQVLQNLVQNAVRYSPEGGPITVRLSTQDGEARIAVTDRGIGIPAHALPNLGGRFYRAPNVERHQISGLGIGRYGVNEIVALHGGRVDVTSTEGAGSTFTIHLPLIAAPDALPAGDAAPDAGPDPV